MTDYLTRVCPECGGRLCVNSSDPDRVYCNTCEHEGGQCETSIDTRQDKFVMPCTFDDVPCMSREDFVREARLLIGEMKKEEKTGIAGIGVAMSRLLNERAMERTRLILKADSLHRLCGFVRAPVRPVFYVNSEALALLQADIAQMPSDEPCNKLCGIPFRVVRSPDAPDIALSLEYDIKEHL